MCGIAGCVSFNRDLGAEQMTADSMTEIMSCHRANVQIRSRLSITELDRQLLTLKLDTAIAHFLEGPSSGRRLLAGLALAVTLVIGACSAPSPPSSARGLSEQPSTSVRPSGPPDPLSGLASLAVQRIMTGDQVAAAKFGTHQPIDDPPVNSRYWTRLPPRPREWASVPRRARSSSATRSKPTKSYNGACTSGGRHIRSSARPIGLI